MRELFDELLIFGSFILLLFKMFFYLADYVFNETSVSSYLLQLIENVVWIFVLYMPIIILFGSRFISRQMKKYPRICYYLKSVGWIPYAYLIGFIFYLIYYKTLNHYELEKFWHQYWISEICIAASLIIAWVRKHPRFLVE
ncbi:MAG: hypothetical protein IJ099_00670 [Alphaproteobacteria bacterium]|nr:hypothetical protein [Alphaproteobacteria bacterium]